jgi:hypothetical protein
MQQIDYRKWPIEAISTDELLLDPFNPRIPFNLLGKLTQPEIISYLAENEDVASIADNIVGIGYFSFDPVIGFKEGSQTIIVEGNRRLCSCKLLRNPDQAPANKRQHFKKLSQNINGDNISKINAVIAPTRAEASSLLVNKHTHNLQRGWRTVMQAAYFHSLLTSGKTVESLSDELNLMEAVLRNEIQSFNVFIYLQKLPFKGTLKTDVANAHGFPLSTLTRIYEKPFGKKFLNLHFNKRGEIIRKVYNDGLMRIISDLLTGSIDSRKLNKSEEIKDYIDGIALELEASGGKKGSKKSTKKTYKSRKKGRAQKVDNFLIPADFKPKSTNRRLLEVLDELQRIDYKEFPNASAITLRCLLEISVFHHLDKKGAIAQMRKEKAAELKKAGKKNYDLSKYPQLSDMMRRLGDNKKSPIADSQIIKSIQGFNADKHLEILNLVIHNHHYYPTPEKISKIANCLLGLFGKIL